MENKRTSKGKIFNNIFQHQNPLQSQNRYSNDTRIKASEIVKSARLIRNKQSLEESATAKRSSVLINQRREPNKLDEYKLEEEIGRGSFAVVKRGLHKETETQYAFKIYEKNNSAHTKEEISILQVISHPNIVKLFEVIDRPKQVVLVLEYAQGISLFDRIKRQKMSIQEAVYVFKQLVNAIQFCHSRGIFHRDIKLENIIIDDQLSIKLIDFGLATLSSEMLFCGTPGYMAPEIINRGFYCPRSADLWSCGIVFFALVCGFLPFEGNNKREIFDNITRAKPEYPTFLDKNTHQLLEIMLQKDPRKRKTAEEVLYILNNTFK